MTEQDAKLIEKELTERLKLKYSDIKTHVDLLNEIEEINISFFWDRISVNQWNNAKTYRMKYLEYNHKLKTEIIPFFE